MLLFLDFDGVLHHNALDNGLFIRVPLLEQWLERWPGVDVAISSSWRTAHSQEELVEMLGPAIGGRVVGCTPVPPRDEVGKVYVPVGAPRRYERQSEIEAWLASSWHPDRPWVALGDMAFLFQPDCQRLVVCDGRIGITEDTLLLLDDHAARAGLVPVSVVSVRLNPAISFPA